MPYLYTGKLGKSDSTTSSRPGFVKLGATYSGYGARMNAILKKLNNTMTFTLDAALFPKTTVMLRTADAALLPIAGNVYVTATYDATSVATVGVFGNWRSDVVSQDLWRSDSRSQARVIYTTSASSFVYEDVGAPLGKAVTYYVVTTASDGTTKTTYASPITLSGFGDWCFVNDDRDFLTLYVSDSSSTRVVQTEDFSPIGSAYKTVQQGIVIGNKGRIELAVTATDRDFVYASLRDLAAHMGQVYLKSPFGDVYAVDIGQMTMEFVTIGNLKVTIPYIENAIA